MNTPPMSVGETLQRAKALIEKPDDWAQGLRAGVAGLPTCAGIAISRACREDDVPVPMSVSKVINALGFDSFPKLMDWNDAPSTTHADVLAAFDKAILAATEQERIP